MLDFIDYDVDPVEKICSASSGISIECDPQLMELAVFAVVRDTEREPGYHAARESCYEKTGMEARDVAFAEFNRAWFVQFDLGRAVVDALDQQPDALAGVSRCILAPAIRRKDECAELYHRPQATEDPAAKPCLVLRICPESFKSPDSIRRVLCHELMHIRDMLDPRFEYNASLDQFFDEKGAPNAIRERYRVLWDCHIDGRLHRAGRLPGNARDLRLAEFKGTFRMLGENTEAAFSAAFDTAQLRHSDLIAWARNPRGILELAAIPGVSGAPA